MDLSHYNYIFIFPVAFFRSRVFQQIFPNPQTEFHFFVTTTVQVSSITSCVRQVFSIVYLRNNLKFCITSFASRLIYRISMLSHRDLCRLVYDVPNHQRSDFLTHTLLQCFSVRPSHTHRNTVADLRRFASRFVSKLHDILKKCGRSWKTLRRRFCNWLDLCPSLPTSVRGKNI